MSGSENALADGTRPIDYPSLLEMERPNIRSYPPETVIAEKCQAMVALGLMKDFHDLWSVPKSLGNRGGGTQSYFPAVALNNHRAW